MDLKQFSIGKNSLARQALTGMALRITVIIIIATGVSYWHMQNTLRASILQNLENYADMRGKAESEQFLLAERQTIMVRDEFLRRLQEMGDYDPKDEFDRIFVREADGLIRVRPEINDHRHHATAYLRHDVLLTPDLRRRFYIGWQLMDQWGPMLVNRFFSGFMNMPEQLSINFCPKADWGRSATRDLDITIYETVWRSTIEKNPQRLTFWTTVYYDPGADEWMVSCVTPGDYHGKWVATGGQDVSINDLIKRTTADPVEKGAWNFIVDAQANLIAHPNLTGQIAKAGGNLQVNELGDARLTAMVNAVLAKGDDHSHTLELPDIDVILGITRIDGPGWYFVTVYPRQLLTAQALSTAGIFLAIGFCTLLLALAIMAAILRRRITVPIARVVSVTEQISLGDFSVRLEPQDNNELGLLATSVNRMAMAVGERDAALKGQFNEVRKIEERFRTLVNTIPDLIWLKDADGVFIACNHMFENLFGAREADIIGKTDYDFVNRELADFFREHDRKAMAAGKSSSNEEWLTFADNGYHGLFDTIKTPMYDAEGALIGVLGIARDITERKKAVEEMEGLNKELEQIIYAASHDLKTPLVNINGYSRELKSTLDDITRIIERDGVSSRIGEEVLPLINELPDSFRFISTSVVRMDALLNGLLAFSRSGRAELKKVDIDMNVLINEIACNLNYRLKDAGASLEVADLPGCNGDREQISRIFLNLMENAVKYLDPARRGEIKVTGYKKDNLSVYCVEDNGIGIPAAYQKQIFHIFHQLDPSKAGEGLGLAIVQRMAERHGGKVWLESEADKGSRFYVELPGITK
ncbi:MAG: ATP-binding protein [Thermodesulfovibrionia bacterium]|nr:ATP-binding protein [Thermodesulfovibrionia bacterium]